MNFFVNYDKNKECNQCPQKNMQCHQKLQDLSMLRDQGFILGEGAGVIVLEELEHDLCRDFRLWMCLYVNKINN